MTIYVYILNMNVNVVKIMLGVMATWASYGRGGLQVLWCHFLLGAERV